MWEYLKFLLELMDELVSLKLEFVGLLQDVVDKFLFELFGGMIKWVSLVCVFVLDFDLVFLDELMFGFDLIGVVVFDLLIVNLSFMLGLIVYMVMYDFDSFYFICDWIVVFG